MHAIGSFLNRFIWGAGSRSVETPKVNDLAQSSVVEVSKVILQDPTKDDAPPEIHLDRVSTAVGKLESVKATEQLSTDILGTKVETKEENPGLLTDETLPAALNPLDRQHHEKSVLEDNLNDELVGKPEAIILDEKEGPSLDGNKGEEHKQQVYIKLHNDQSLLDESSQSSKDKPVGKKWEYMLDIDSSGEITEDIGASKHSPASEDSDNEFSEDSVERKRSKTIPNIEILEASVDVKRSGEMPPADDKDNPLNVGIKRDYESSSVDFSTKSAMTDEEEPVVRSEKRIKESTHPFVVKDHDSSSRSSSQKISTHPVTVKILSHELS